MPSPPPAPTKTWTYSPPPAARSQSLRPPRLTDPPSPRTLSKSLQKMQGVVDACQPRLVLVSTDVNRLRLASKLNVMSSARRLWPDLPYKVLGTSAVSGGVAAGRGTWLGIGAGVEAGGGRPQCFDEASLLENDVAFLQFTSGSTSEPKGVMVTFGNLAHNAMYISRRAESVSVD